MPGLGFIVLVCLLFACANFPCPYCCYFVFVTQAFVGVVAIIAVADDVAIALGAAVIAVACVVAAAAAAAVADGVAIAIRAAVVAVACVVAAAVAAVACVVAAAVAAPVAGVAAESSWRF